jgi:hypothetical protein
MVSSISFLCTLALTSLLHPMHVSVTEIEMDEKDKRLEVMMRVFIDDLETTLKENLKQPSLDILNPKGQTVDQMMETYLRSHFKIMLDNKQQVIKYLGHEQENEAFIFYVEVDKVKKWKTIQVHNDIITEIYGDQSNLVHVTWLETIRSLRLTRDHPVDKLSFETHYNSR